MARVLVVDDEEGVRSFLAEALTLDGHAVTESPDGADALRRLDRHAFDVVLTDLKMPGVDGETVVRKLRAEQPEVEVIVLTAHGTVESAVEAMKLGAFDYLRKPVSGPAELRLLVNRAAERRSLRALADRADRDGDGAPPLTYGAAAMARVAEAIHKVARTQATVLLTGESGTGKEVAARAIHRASDRAAAPFVAINCAALSEHLLESELFGHERGAFTGAHERRRGRLELAAGGTFFLDEVGELRPDLQAKLLRVLQERCFERVGGHRAIEADVRWIAATNRDLGTLMREGRFREDLYHRLAVFPIHLPPLRERHEDIAPLARALLERIRRDLKRGPLSLSPAAERCLREAPWPGNVRQLANALERAAILAEAETIDAEHLDGIAARPEPAAIGGGAARARHREGEPVTLDALERDAIVRALDAVSGNRRLAAERLGIGLRTLYDKLKRYDLA
ncbi:MAG: sigma-54 dependent transcriptional regulator [bacterium]